MTDPARSWRLHLTPRDLCWYTWAKQTGGTDLATLPANYDEQVYAALLGKVIGVHYGRPVEGWSDERIWEAYGELNGYLERERYFPPDDDLSGALTFIRALEDYGPQLTARDIGDTWLNYLGDEHGTLWWGGYGVSTEHTAYLNLANGIPAPRSGSIEQNGEVVAEQIGGQIFIDPWGLVCPGKPQLAAGYARRAASVSHDGNAVYGGMFIAGIEAAAFEEKDPLALLSIGLSLIPSHSTYARVIRDVVRWRHTCADWRDCMARIKEKYGYDRYGGGCHVIPNAAVVAMALAYSDGDFSRALNVANMAGWDTDCNVGNVGCVMGLVSGLDGIHNAATDWFSPVNDHLLISLNIGSECILDIPNVALYISNLGRMVNGTGKRQTHKGRVRYHFALPGSTHGWEADRSPGRSAVRSLTNASQDRHNGRCGLRLAMARLSKTNLGVVYRKTFFTTRDFDHQDYEFHPAPIIYPGQELTATLYLEQGAEVATRLFTRDLDGNEFTPGDWTSLAVGRKARLSIKVPSSPAPVERIGLIFSARRSTRAVVYLEQVDWYGTPDIELDLSRPEPMVGWSYLRGRWFSAWGALNGSHFGRDAETYTGALSWRDYRYQVRLRPHCGERHRILFRVQGARRSYAFGLAPGGRITFEKNRHGYREVASAPLAWKTGHEYTLAVEVKGNHMRGFVDGQPVLEWQDTDRPWDTGCIGLGLKDGRTLFYSVILRPPES